MTREVITQFTPIVGRTYLRNDEEYSVLPDAEDDPRKAAVIAATLERLRGTPQA